MRHGCSILLCSHSCIHFWLYFQALATSTKINATTVLEETVEAIHLLEDVNTQIAQGNAMATTVLDTQLRSLETMQVITAEIEATTISQVQVNDVLRKAEEGLQVAEDILEITQEAA